MVNIQKVLYNFVSETIHNVLGKPRIQHRTYILLGSILGGNKAMFYFLPISVAI